MIRILADPEARATMQLGGVTRPPEFPFLDRVGACPARAAGTLSARGSARAGRPPAGR
jgi:hypothetical protein